MKSTTPTIPYYDVGDRLSEAELAEIRNMTKRGLRAERQRGDGPHHTFDCRTPIYSRRKYLEWLERRERRPVRSREASRREAETAA